MKKENLHADMETFEELKAQLQEEDSEAPQKRTRANSESCDIIQPITFIEKLQKNGTGLDKQLSPCEKPLVNPADVIDEINEDESYCPPKKEISTPETKLPFVENLPLPMLKRTVSIPNKLNVHELIINKLGPFRS